MAAANFVPSALEVIDVNNVGIGSPPVCCVKTKGPVCVDDVVNVFPESERSDHDVTCPVVVEEIVVVALASSHRDRPGRREGINLSSFKTFAMIYTTSVMYLPEIYVAFITF